MSKNLKIFRMIYMDLIEKLYFIYNENGKYNYKLLILIKFFFILKIIITS